MFRREVLMSCPDYLTVDDPGHVFADLWTPARAVGDGTYEPANAQDANSASMAFVLVYRVNDDIYRVYATSGRYEWPAHNLGGAHADLWLGDAGGFALTQETHPQRLGQIDGPDHFIWQPFDMFPPAGGS